MSFASNLKNYGEAGASMVHPPSCKVWDRRGVGDRCPDQLTVAGHPFGQRSGIALSLCRHVQRLVRWTQAGPASDGALRSVF
jgi:hypothetical protein